MSYPLEPSPEDMREMGEAALGFVVDFLRGLPDTPASDYDGAEEFRRGFREDVPLDGVRFEAALDTVRRATAKGVNTAGPGFLGYIPGGGLFAASLADLLANTINRFVNLWYTAPAAAQIEWNVVRWMCDLFGYPAEARGVLTSGGSMANFSAIVTARRALLPEDFLAGTMYVSDQAHASLSKAAALAGFPPRNVRIVPSSEDLHLDVDALRVAVEADRRDGLRPFLVVASAGTTNTGAVDPIAELLTFARVQGLWLHVDGAYGGFFQLTDRGRALFEGIGEADSITLDPHKGMFLPYGTGCLLVRDGARLREAHFVSQDYLQDLAPEAEVPNFAEYSPELSRDFRGLRVWLPLKLHGLEAFRGALDEKLDLARYLHDALTETPGLTLPWRPELTVVPFWLQPPGASPDETNALNRRLLERINASRRVFMSSTLVRGRFVIRPCIVVHRTHRDRIDEAIDVTRKAVADLTGS
ncbi:MAG TPA: aminotransferase class I/II-fold pyridoxal phosphate-dependent enzyme [Actinomycetota bacterium]|nr:aminotransferase class I/II-fold pyridoxal phosphate-dependent enzyme [Actinomycetota bacterium]